MFESIRARILPHSRHQSSWRMTFLGCRDGRAAISQSLVRLAAVADRERIELAPLIEEFALEHRGATRRRLLRLAKRMQTGSTLIDALEQTPDVISDEDLLTLQFANQSGILPQAYADLIDRYVNRFQESQDIVRGALAYAFALSIAFAIIVTFQMTFIAPTIIEMFDEFGLRLPTYLQTLISVTGAIGRILPLLVLIGVIGLVISGVLRPLRALQRRLASRFSTSVASLRKSQLLRLLASSTEAGRPIPGALSTLAHHHYDPAVRLKLLIARNEVEQGQENWQSLCDAKLLCEHEAHALANTSTSLQSWIMQRLASQKEQDVARRRAILSRLLHPAIVLFFGALTLWVTSAFFSVLVTMILVLS